MPASQMSKFRGHMHWHTLTVLGQLLEFRPEFIQNWAFYSWDEKIANKKECNE